MLMYTGHMVSLALYLMVLVTCVSLLWALLKGTRLTGFNLFIVVAFAVSLTLQSSIFMALQVDWISEDYNELIGDATAYAWLAFDYFNGLALLCFATCVRIFLSWKEA